MLMKPEPLFEAVESLKTEKTKVLLTSPSGEPFTQKMAHELAKEEHLIVICGHYEGVDERVRQVLVDRDISIGDYVLTSGNLPAMVIVDAVTRLLPGALGSPESEIDESFEDGLLEYPQYSAVGPCPTFCCPAIIKKSPNGDAGNLKNGPPPSVRIS